MRHTRGKSAAALFDANTTNSEGDRAAQFRRRFDLMSVSNGELPTSPVILSVDTVVCDRM
jgi:hypothetical protein